jgi:hypothetical protein
MSAEPFVMRPLWSHSGDAASIRVKDGDLIVIDKLARRFRFQLGGPDSPCYVVRYLHSGGKGQQPYWVWVVTDAHGRSFLEGSEKVWVGGDFSRLAEAGGLRLAPDGFNLGCNAPPQRPDYVDFEPLRMPFWIWFFLVGITFPLLVVFGWAWLAEGVPWVWTVAWSVIGVYSIWRRTTQDVTVDRNRSALPPDERPADPPKKGNITRRAWIFAAVALTPAAIAYWW